MGTACWTAASAVAEQAEKGHHHQRLCMPAPAPAEGAAAAATGMALQEATTPRAPGGCPASTAAGGPPAEERARDRWEGARRKGERGRHGSRSRWEGGGRPCAVEKEEEERVG